MPRVKDTYTTQEALTCFQQLHDCPVAHAAKTVNYQGTSKTFWITLPDGTEVAEYCAVFLHCPCGLQKYLTKEELDEWYAGAPVNALEETFCGHKEAVVGFMWGRYSCTTCVALEAANKPVPTGTTSEEKRFWFWLSYDPNNSALPMSKIFYWYLSIKGGDPVYLSREDAITSAHNWAGCDYLVEWTVHPDNIHKIEKTLGSGIRYHFLTVQDYNDINVVNVERRNDVT